ncbi:hypothetical protein DRP07_00100 [Archaeoglobales archaeon]|nr:MAG: hypothetical protein DRP07_00100 [Archaeoglobales archaeon]
MSDWERKTWWECDSCHKEIPYKAERGKDWEAFEVPIKTCAITHAVTIGYRLVIICSDCLKKRGKPIEVYMGSLIFEKHGD